MAKEPEMPRRPSGADFYREEKSEEVALPDEATMLGILRALERPEDPPNVEKLFFPPLLRYADQTILVTQVATVVVLALREYLEKASDDVNERTNLRDVMAQYAPRVIDVLIADPVKRQEAQEFFASALNG